MWKLQAKFHELLPSASVLRQLTSISFVDRFLAGDQDSRKLFLVHVPSTLFGGCRVAELAALGRVFIVGWNVPRTDA